MPQSTGCSPAPIRRRAASTLSTVGCSLKPSGTLVTLSARRLMSLAGKVVSVGCAQWVPRNGVQSSLVGAGVVAQHGVFNVLALVQRISR